MAWLDLIRQAASRGIREAEVLAGKLKVNLLSRGRLIPLCLAVAAASLIVIVVTAVFMGRPKDTVGGGDTELDEIFGYRSIPPEEFFLPQEPDFLPETLPERERRKFWTEEDARPFWIDPLDEGTREYTDLMSTVIDDLLEAIP
jgi:hypothetical protein